MTVCCVRGCKNRILKNVSKSVKFFALPSERIRYKKGVNAQLFKRRCAWLKNANKKFLDDYVTARFCSAHFQGGKLFVSLSVSHCSYSTKPYVCFNFKVLPVELILTSLIQIGLLLYFQAQ